MALNVLSPAIFVARVFEESGTITYHNSKPGIAWAKSAAGALCRPIPTYVPNIFSGIICNFRDDSGSCTHEQCVRSIGRYSHIALSQWYVELDPFGFGHSSTRRVRHATLPVLARQNTQWWGDVPLPMVRTFRTCTTCSSERGIGLCTSKNGTTGVRFSREAQAFEHGKSPFGRSVRSSNFRHNSDR